MQPAGDENVAATFIFVLRLNAAHFVGQVRYLVIVRYALLGRFSATTCATNL